MAGAEKIQNVEMEGLDSSGGHGKYLTDVSFPWPPREAGLSVIYFIAFFIKTIFEKEGINIVKAIAINVKSEGF